MAYTLTADPRDDPVLGDDGYPHDIELERIKTWLDLNKITTDEVLRLLDYVKPRWKYSDIGYWQETVDKDGTRFIQMSTGGWSGNESIMAELRDSFFWMLCFESHFRGGHYTFKVPVW